MRILVVAVLLVILSSCNDNEPKRSNGFTSVEIETLLEDSLLDVRALEIKNDFVRFVTSEGKTGVIQPYAQPKDILGMDNQKGVEILQFQFVYDTIIPNFRSLAITKNSSFAIGISSPALLFDLSNDFKFKYIENHPKAFYDSMDFWNNQEGIAIGDPTDDCMSVIITRDGGETWTKLPCEDLPKTINGEAAFAASDTNIAIVDNHTWVATGGKASRILYSPDKGATWEVYDTPIIQGKETTGMYSLDFYDAQHGFAIGGDYTQPNNTINNKIRTEDGGKTWSVVANGKGPGYRSCVQYVPNSNAKELVAVGFKGIDYTNNAGDSWKHLSDEGFYTIRFLNDSVAYAAGKGRISKLTFKN